MSTDWLDAEYVKQHRESGGWFKQPGDSEVAFDGIVRAIAALERPHIENDACDPCRYCKRAIDAHIRIWRACRAAVGEDRDA